MGDASLPPLSCISVITRERICIYIYISICIYIYRTLVNAHGWPPAYASNNVLREREGEREGRGVSSSGLIVNAELGSGLHNHGYEHGYALIIIGSDASP